MLFFSNFVLIRMNPNPPKVSFRTFLKHGIILFAVLGVYLAIIFFTNESIVLRKVLIRLVVPAGLCWMGLLALTYFLFVFRLRFAGIACLVITLMYSLAGNSFVTQSMATSLEQPYKDFALHTTESYDVVVLLGGGTMMGYNAYPQLGQSGDRVMVTLHLFVAGKAKRIFCTGSQLLSRNQNQGNSPGEQARSILIKAGVPGDNIELIQGRNTKEEIQNLAEKFRHSKLKVAIVSSAWHLPRVMRLADRYRFEADPIPSNFVSKPQKPGLMSVIPSAGNLVINGMLMKERLAQMMGQ